ncbi:hypothetical protein N431DRAFT_435763 [Stipitochalara longipes BDJ]|nr:hypothetical protein N431DRAFT_435763 [Stipitochalara longipes BDJ]
MAKRSTAKSLSTAKSEQLGAKECACSKLAQWDQMIEPNESLFERALTPNFSTNTFDILLEASHPTAFVECNWCSSTPNSFVKALPTSHRCQPNIFPPCTGCMSKPNFKSSELTTFMKPTGCRAHQSMHLSPLIQVSKVNILAELNALQERCSTLAHAFAQSSPTTPHHQDGYALLPPTSVDDGVAMSVSLNNDNLSSTSSHTLTRPGGWEVSSADDLHANTMYQPSQNPLGRAPSTIDMMGPEVFMPDQDTLPEDHLQLDAHLENNFESWFQDIFDVNAASIESLPENFDAYDGETTSVGATAAENMSNITPTLPSVSEATSHLTVGTSAVNRIEHRHHCPSCIQTFGRRSDRNRHAMVHNPVAPRYDCSFPGCDRVGRHGFLRRDKLTQHQAYRRH